MVCCYVIHTSGKKITTGICLRNERDVDTYFYLTYLNVYISNFNMLLYSTVQCTLLTITDICHTVPKIF